MPRTYFLTTTLLLALILLSGCEKDSPSTPPDSLLHALADAAENGKPQSVWRALPPRYRADINALRTTAAARIDPELWTLGAEVAQKAAQLLRQRRDEIAQSPIAASPAIQPFVTESKLADLIDLLLQEIATVDKFRTVDLDHLLEVVGDPLMKQGLSLARLLTPESADRFEAFGQVETTVLHQDETRALVRVSYPDAAPEELVFVHVDGTWTMKELDDQWEEVMKNARTAIDGWDLSASGREAAAERLSALGQKIDALIDLPAGAEFNAALVDLLQN
ncbi:MAG: hypothetical protein AAF581_06305 [Planctomycetota bacterium]